MGSLIQGKLSGYATQLVYVPRLRTLFLSRADGVLAVSFLLDGKPRAAVWDVKGDLITTQGGSLLHLDASRRVGVYDAETDSTGKIPFRWKSNLLSLGDPSLWKLFRRVEAFFTAHPGTKITLGIEEGVGDGQGVRQEQTMTSTQAQSVHRAVVASSVQGRYAVLTLSGESAQGTSALVAPPISIEFRARDRMGRA